MNQSVFIMTAYGATALLVVGLCLATWLRARSVKRQLKQHEGQ